MGVNPSHDCGSSTDTILAAYERLEAFRDMALHRGYHTRADALAVRELCQF
jgi:hypothetical protein